MLHHHTRRVKPHHYRKASRQSDEQGRRNSGTRLQVLAPLPGTVTEVCVKVGDAVAMGDTVVVLEAMKMQNNIEAENSGTVTSVLVSKGDTVMEGAPLITIG